MFGISIFLESMLIALWTDDHRTIKVSYTTYLSELINIITFSIAIAPENKERGWYR